MHSLVASLMLWITQNTMYTSMVVEPTVFTVPHSFFVTNACRKTSPVHADNETTKECDVVGWYNDTDKIYIDEDLGDGGLRDSILLHELVHHFQYHSGRFQGTCQDRVEREKEAYSIQNKYVWLVQKEVRMWNPSLMMFCSKHK